MRGYIDKNFRGRSCGGGDDFRHHFGREGRGGSPLRGAWEGLSILLTLIMTLLISLLYSIPTPVHSAASPTLTLKEAIDLALKSDKTIKDAKEDLAEVEERLKEVGVSPLQWSFSLSTEPFYWKNGVRDPGMEYILKGEWTSSLEVMDGVDVTGSLIGEFTNDAALRVRPGVTLSLRRDLLRDRERLKKEIELLGLRKELLEAESRLFDAIWARKEKVMEDYYALIFQGLRLELTRKSHERAERLYLDAKLRMEKGLLSKTTMMDMETSIASSRRSLKGLEESYEKARRVFFDGLGLREGEERSLEEINSLELPAIDLDEEQVISLALERSPSLKVKLLELEIARAELEMAREESKPDLFLQGNYDSAKGEWSLYIKGEYSFKGPRDDKPLPQETSFEKAGVGVREEEERIRRELQGKFDELDDLRFQLEMARIALEKRSIITSSTKEEYERGLISRLAYEEAVAALEEERLKLKEKIAGYIRLIADIYHYLLEDPPLDPTTSR